MATILTVLTVMHILIENCFISIQIPLKFVPRDQGIDPIKMIFIPEKTFEMSSVKF